VPACAAFEHAVRHAGARAAQVLCDLLSLKIYEWFLSHSFKGLSWIGMEAAVLLRQLILRRRRRSGAMQKKPLFTPLLLSIAALPTVATAQFSANVGWVSDYIFRGLYQEESSPYGGFDFESDSGFYAGVWGADVDLGLEVDLYFGYGGSFGEDGGFSVGYTGYFYTEDGVSFSTYADDPGSFPGIDPDTYDFGYDDTYTEINLGISYGIFALDYAVGEWDGWGTPSDYTFTTLTIAPEVGPYYSYNTFGDEAAGDYIEIGYGFTFMDELDISVAFLYDLNASEPDALALDAAWSGHVDTALTFGVSKSFSIGD
jgi:uncharacterized protein (TIGR02001 family)